MQPKKQKVAETPRIKRQIELEDPVLMNCSRKSLCSSDIKVAMGSKPDAMTSNGSKRSIILGELEDELERQLEEKAKRNELSANNVKSLLKAVLTQEDVFKYVETTVAKSDELPEYQLKLTRAKAKELIDRIPKIAPLLCLPTPQKKSDIDILIREELPEDSSDEEYQPLDETIDDEDEVNLMSPESHRPTPRRLNAGQVENIGQRTRSKFSLSATPLEAIEQAFIPPDITEDMYNTECDNQDWLNFLKELVQPLDTSTGQEAHDDENDPEYNIQPDDVEAPDNEELRADPAVKISKKEINDLMYELFEYTKMHFDSVPSDEEKPKASRTTEASENDLIVEQHPFVGTRTSAEPQIRPGEDPSQLSQCQSEKGPDPTVGVRNLPQPTTVVKRVWVADVISEEQHLLIKQHLAQHTQLLLQSYLLSLGSPFVDDKIQKGFKRLLLNLKTRQDSASADSTFFIPTLNESLELMIKYETFVDENLNSLHKWHRESSKPNTYLKTKRKGVTEIHPTLMELCLRSPAFQYPLLLPKNGFRSDMPSNRKALRFTVMDDILISSALHDCAANLRLNIEKKDVLSDCCNLIRTAVLPHQSPSVIFDHIRRKKMSPTWNHIKQVMLTGCAPAIEHFVVPIDQSAKLRPLYLTDVRLFHNPWHKALYKEREYKKSNKR